MDTMQHAGLPENTAGQARHINGLIQKLIAKKPGLGGRFDNARRIIRIFRRPSFYEISQKCNLWCEGC